MLRILEAIRRFKKKKIKFYQASTSEMFGGSKPPQDEKTYFSPKSPYGAAKLYGHWITKIYRESYNIFACSGILFNHESPLRGETFVTKKVVISAVKYFKNKKEILQVGNLDAIRDWGHAKDYVENMWMMLQKKYPNDYVIASNKSYTVRKFIEQTYKELGIQIKWIGKGLKEVGIDMNTKKIIIKVNAKYFRPNEVDNLRGNSSRAKKELNWKPKVSFTNLIKEMIKYELKLQS